MKTTTLGFIGAGRITRILLQAFKKKGLTFKGIVISDTNNEIAAKLKNVFPQIEVATTDQSASQDIVFIALHPPAINETLEKISTVVSDRSIVISLAPKIKIAGIADKLKTKYIIRLIPNATSIINSGYNPVCFSSSFSSTEKSEIINVLGTLGNTFEVPEDKLEAFAIVSAMAPTYFWFQWKKLCDIGIEIGLDKKEARQAVYETLIAAANTLFKSDLTDEEVFDLIPVKPLGENEKDIESIFDQKLKGLYGKLIS